MINYFDLYFNEVFDDIEVFTEEATTEEVTTEEVTTEIVLASSSDPWTPEKVDKVVNSIDLITIIVIMSFCLFIHSLFRSIMLRHTSEVK